MHAPDNPDMPASSAVPERRGRNLRIATRPFPGAYRMRRHGVAPTTRTTRGAPTPMSTAARRSRAGWFADRPIAVKLGAVVGLMAVVGILLAVVAVRGVHSLRDGEQRLYTEVAQPMVTLGAIQRSYQGDRVRIV